MRAQSKNSKSENPHSSQVNSASRRRSLKTSSRERVIIPISPEPDIRAAVAAQKRADSRHPTRPSPHVLAPTNKPGHRTSGSEAKVNSHIKLAALSSDLDGKSRRARHWLTFLGQLLFWAAVYCVFAF